MFGAVHCGWADYPDDTPGTGSSQHGFASFLVVGPGAGVKVFFSLFHENVFIKKSNFLKIINSNLHRDLHKSEGA